MNSDSYFLSLDLKVDKLKSQKMFNKSGDRIEEINSDMPYRMNHSEEYHAELDGLLRMNIKELDSAISFFKNIM